MILSVNQTRQFYFVDKVPSVEGESIMILPIEQIFKNSEPGSGMFSPAPRFAMIPEAQSMGVAKSIALYHKGFGGITRSDLIDLDKIITISMTAPSKMRKYIPFYNFRLKDECTYTDGNGDTYVIPGQSFVLDIIHNNFVAPGDENTYMKHGAVYSKPNMTVEDFYSEMARSIKDNYKRELNNELIITNTLDFEVTYTITTTPTQGDPTTEDVVKHILIPENIYTEDLLDEKIDAVGEEIAATLENNQEITNATSEDPTVNGITITFDANKIKSNYRTAVFPIIIPSISLEGNEVYNADNDYMTEWLDFDVKNDVFYEKDYYIGNGYEIADLEYACMTARGDYYGKTTYPDNFDTKYFVNPRKEYYLLDIHYYLIEDNENIQRSEKTLTVAIPADVTIGSGESEKIFSNTFLNELARFLVVTRESGDDVIYQFVSPFTAPQLIGDVDTEFPDVLEFIFGYQGDL